MLAPNPIIHCGFALVVSSCATTAKVEINKYKQHDPKFKNYNGKKFTVNEIVKQNNFYIAKAEFLPKDSDNAILTDFRVRKKDGKLYILDFIAEGISLIETQRSEFNATIDSQGIEPFLKNLEEKVKKLKSNKKLHAILTKLENFINLFYIFLFVILPNTK